MAEPVPGISAVPDETNARYFHVVVAGKDSLMSLADFHDVIIFKSQGKEQGSVRSVWGKTIEEETC